MIDLENRKWPSSPLKAKDLDEEQIKQFLYIRADYEKSAFVTEGHLEVRQLGAKEFTNAIPPGESGITALLSHSNGHIYGATSGPVSHIFFYNPSPDADAVADIGIIAENAGIAALAEQPDGTVIGAGVRKGGATKQPFLFRYRPCEVLLREKKFQGMGVREIFDLPAEDQLFFSTIDPCHSSGELEVMPCPIEEPVEELVLAPDGKNAFLTGGKSGWIYRYELASGKAEKWGRLDCNGNHSNRLIVDKTGRLYGAGLYGQLFTGETGSSDPGFHKLSCRAPSLKGCELYNRVTAWTLEPDTGDLYGGTVDGLLFRFVPAEERVYCLGKPAAQSRVSGMAVTGGKIYALIGEASDCCHLCVYEPDTGENRDLGCLLARSERPWNGYRFEAMTAGINGTLFLGEFDRISQLFLYFPPLGKKR